MLSIASQSTLAFANPVQAVVNTVAQIGIVGFDKRAFQNAIKEQAAKSSGSYMPPTVNRKVERALNNVVMTTGLESDAPFPARSIGDFGFDPLGLGTDETFVAFREAEIKHGRLAMLAAIAWPLQEILHPILVDTVYNGNAPDMLVETNGFSPSLLNGGLTQENLLPALAILFVGGAFLEEKDNAARAAQGLNFNEYPNSRQAGNLNFDPLNIYKPLDVDGKRGMQEAELMNGRVAMLAITGYVAAEVSLGMPIVRATPQVFEPLFLQPGFRAFLDSSFGMASMDGAIDGIAY